MTSRARWAGVVVAGLILLAGAGCRDESAGGPTPVTVSEAEVEATGPIFVAVVLPRTGHSEPVLGSAVDEQGDLVANFEIPADFAFLEPSSAENDWRPATSMVDEREAVVLSLPGAGRYTFTIGQVFFWGGCGTCGAVFAGGAVDVEVSNGSEVILDLGDFKGAT